MAIKEFELFHGAVLTKLVRSDQLLTLRMIETRVAEDWSTYLVNDQIRVLIKHSATFRETKKDNATAWQFVFNSNQIRQLDVAKTWAALVCGSKCLGNGEMEICLLAPGQVGKLINVTSNSQQALTVKSIPAKSLRVFNSNVKNELIISRNRMDTWVIQ